MSLLEDLLKQNGSCGRLVTTKVVAVAESFYSAPPKYTPQRFITRYMDASLSADQSKVQPAPLVGQVTPTSIKNGHYFNPWPQWYRSGFLKMAKWMLSRKSHAELSSDELDDKLPVLKPDWNAINNPPSDKVQYTWIGHSSFLVQMDGLNILTDPVFSERCSPTQLLGPKRYRPTPMTIQELPPIDFVVISHNHYDHLDHKAVKELGNKPLWVVPQGHKSWFESCDISNFVELGWWDQYPINDNVKVMALPCQHWSKRTAFDDFEALWASWAIVGSKKVYFAGDTGYCDTFKEIGREVGPFDLSFIPIGAYEPRDIMCPQHVDPDQSVQIHVDIQSKKSVGMHWGTFILTDEHILEPPQKLAQAMQQQGLPDDQFIVVKHGETSTN